MEMTGETMEEVTQRYEEGAISVEEVTRAMQYASSENGKYYQSMEKQSKTLAGQISTLKDNVSSLAGTLAQGLSNAISNDVLPSINNLMTGLEKAYSEEGIGGFAEALGNAIAKIFTELAEKTPQFVDISLKIIENLVKGIKDNLESITNSAIEIVTTLITGITNLLPDIGQLGIDLIVSLANGISNNADTLIPQIVNQIIALLNTLQDEENLQKLTDAGVNLIIALIDGIIKSIPSLLFNSEFLLNLLKNTFTGGIPSMKQIGKSLVKSIVNGLKENAGEMWQAGKDLIQGMWNGIVNKWDNLKGNVANFGKGVVNKFKSVFGIHSPSVVFRDKIGKYMAQGIEVGFDKELDNVYNKMQGAIDSETSKMSANVKTSGTYQMAMTGTPKFDLYDNTSNYTTLEVDGKVLAEVVNVENRNREVSKA